jgi:hypothetical protein
MWKDPIVEETRRLRDEYASKLNYNIDEIHEDLQRQQALSTKKTVSFPPRQPSRTPSHA